MSSRVSVALRFVLAGLFCLGMAAGVVAWVTAGDGGRGVGGVDRTPRRTNSASAGDPGSKTADGLVIDPLPLDDSGVALATRFTGVVRDPNSMDQLRDAIKARGRVGLAVLAAELDQLHLSADSPPEVSARGGQFLKDIGMLSLYEGKFAESSAAFRRALDIAKASNAPPKVRAELTALAGIASLRRGEVENCLGCVGPSSCIFPVAKEAVHLKPDGSREAIKYFTDYLNEWPGDLRVRWALNFAYMTLGEYPEKVPARFLVKSDLFGATAGVGKFENVALAAGLTTRGPNMAGSSIFDDFNGDNLPDVVTSALDADLGASISINKGDGTFEDRSAKAGLTDQTYALNVTRADYDNDGDLDLLFLRGGWDSPMRLSLMRNKGDATFEDVTVAAGLGLPIATESAAWADYDNDGDLDLFVCGESIPETGGPAGATSDPRNRSRLYKNNGDGTFVDVSESAGVTNDRFAKGCGWGDYDDDGLPDLFVSNMIGQSRLYHNEGNGTFVDNVLTAGTTGPPQAFACWFFDYDNDGLLDLYVNDRGLSLAEELAQAFKQPIDRTSRPRLYRNTGPGGFEDVTKKAGLDIVMTPMGCNFADVDNDGFLDIYLGTGGMSFSHLVPNRLFHNLGGKTFDDVTVSSGTGHLQKGHGVSFADYDNDGDPDLFVESGGAAPGDTAYNILFRNPGQGGRHYLKVKLNGVKSNRPAVGAKMVANYTTKSGDPRQVHRTVGNNSSFGGNTLVETIGLLDADVVTSLEITWPAGRVKQIFRDLPADRFIEITEGQETLKTVGKAK